ncbi:MULTISPECIES: hypothetical protein [unclassified Methylobacterium]|uniref:hypothetical protein n=1 Tax=unclassified Methylobacterium TaxID=2615210 RepID=UPI0016500FD4|nr:MULTISPECIES: hypothetical protein [unclassified Methylobacterium]
MQRVPNRRRPWKQLAFADGSGGIPRGSDILLGVLGIVLLAGYCLVMAANVGGLTLASG